MINVKATIILLALAVLVFSQATTTIKFKILTAEIPRVVNALNGLHPIPDVDALELTEPQLVKEVIRRWVVKQMERWEQKEAQRIAREGIVPTDGVIE